MASTPNKQAKTGPAERTRRTTKRRAGSKSERGTGAATATKRGGPGRAGTSPQKATAMPRARRGAEKKSTGMKRTATRGRGSKARAGA